MDKDENDNLKYDPLLDSKDNSQIEENDAKAGKSIADITEIKNEDLNESKEKPLDPRVQKIVDDYSAKGDAYSQANFISKLFFYWVYRIIKVSKLIMVKMFRWQIIPLLSQSILDM